MVVKGSNYLVMGSLVEDFLDLLEERFAIEHGAWNERVLSEQNVLTFQSGVEVLIEQIKWLFVFPVQNDFNGILQVDWHSLVIQVVRSFLIEPLFGGY